MSLRSLCYPHTASIEMRCVRYGGAAMVERGYVALPSSAVLAMLRVTDSSSRELLPVTAV